jgi:transposase
MKVIYQTVAGLDVHRDTVTACVRSPGEGQTRQAVIETFSTMNAGLLSLLEWLQIQGVTHVAMESTGVFWKPVYYLLEGNFKVLLVNAKHFKQLPGRKTDVSDSEWLAHLLECGLLRGSFVPPKPIRDLRDLTRRRRVLIDEHGREVQRLHKFLQDAGIKLSSVATDIMGVSGRSMIEALVEGAKDAEALAGLAKGRLRAKMPQLRQALEGHFRDHHAFLVREILDHLDFVDASISRLDKRIEENILPFAQQVNWLTTIPGVARRSAQCIVAEIGVDMGQFPTEDHISSWAGMCPGNNQSAGKHKSGKTRKGDRWLRDTLVEAALGSMRSHDTYLNAQYHRVARHRGHKKAVVAVGHSILVIAYNLLSKGTAYQELGGKYFEHRDKERIKQRCVRQLARLGYSVALEEVVA